MSAGKARHPQTIISSSYVLYGDYCRGLVYICRHVTLRQLAELKLLQPDARLMNTLAPTQVHMRSAVPYPLTV